jgi:hypothetical protein
MSKGYALLNLKDWRNENEEDQTLDGWLAPSAGVAFAAVVFSVDTFTQNNPV